MSPREKALRRGGKLLEALMRERGLTVPQLARQCGRHRSSLWRVVTGHVAPTLPTLGRLVTVLEPRPDEAVKLVNLYIQEGR